MHFSAHIFSGTGIARTGALLLALVTASCVSPTPVPTSVVDPLWYLPTADTEETRFSEEPLRLSIHDALLLGLKRNQALRVEVLHPEIQRTRVEEARARFESTLSGQAALGRDTSMQRLEGRWITPQTERAEAGLEWAKPLPTGAVVGVEAGWRRDETIDGMQEIHRLQTGFFASQPILRGRGASVNRIAIRQAEIDTRISEYELHAFAESLIISIESGYWDYALATRRVGIVHESAALAEQQLHEVERRIEVGALAETERAAARAEVALRREALINARSAAETFRYRLLRLLNPAGHWDLDLSLTEDPALPEPLPPVDAPARKVARALEHRPEIRQARLAIERGELDVVHTRNGWLPRLDVFIRLGQTAYAESFSDAAADSGGNLDWSAGWRMDVPLGRGTERARHARSVWTLRRAEEAFRNLVQTVRLDVLTAAIELERAGEQISATAATRALQEEKLRAEEQKFQVGRSTSLLVAQAQRDVMAGRIAEVEAVTLYLKARVRLHRLEGTLLDRLGMSVQE